MKKPDVICELDDVPEAAWLELKPYKGEVPVHAILTIGNTGKEVYAFDPSMAEFEEAIRCRAEISAHKYLAHHASSEWERYMHTRAMWDKTMQLIDIHMNRTLRQHEQARFQSMHAAFGAVRGIIQGGPGDEKVH